MSQVKKVMAASYYLSEELLMEIMKRLPVKYILRCRCVQKSWYHLLRSPYFIALHSGYRNRLHKYLLFNYHCKFSLHFDDEQCKEPYKLQYPQDMEKIFENSSLIAYDTCNGLICLSARKMPEEVCLWNPAVRAFNVLPNSPTPTDDSLTDSLTLGLAFCYLAKTNDYKIIKHELYYGYRELEIYVYVYSLSTDSWKTVNKAELGGFPYYKKSCSIAVNGVAYWVASIYELREKVIVCFDMEKDTIREIMLPPPCSKENAEGVVLVEKSIFDELLSLFYYDRSTHILHTWVLENAGEPDEVWTKKKSLNFEPSWEPMGFRNNGEIILGSCRKILSYDLEKEEAKDIVDEDSLDAFCWNKIIDPRPRGWLNRFEDTLVWLDVNRQA